jgi:DNA-binding MarR family transcriptional regulator
MIGAMQNKRKKEMTTADLRYICKFYEIDGATSLAKAFDVQQQNISKLVSRLKQSGSYELFKRAWDKRFEGR